MFSKTASFYDSLHAWKDWLTLQDEDLMGRGLIVATRPS